MDHVQMIMSIILEAPFCYKHYFVLQKHFIMFHMPD